MWNYVRKTSRLGNPMTKSQRQAWIENWSIWALRGMIGALQNIINQAKANNVYRAAGLKNLQEDMLHIIAEIKMTQYYRKAKRK